MFQVLQSYYELGSIPSAKYPKQTHQSTLNTTVRNLHVEPSPRCDTAAAKGSTWSSIYDDSLLDQEICLVDDDDDNDNLTYQSYHSLKNDSACANDDEKNYRVPYFCVTLFLKYDTPLQVC